VRSILNIVCNHFSLCYFESYTVGSQAIRNHIAEAVKHSIHGNSAELSKISKTGTIHSPSLDKYFHLLPVI
jgi:hypothetical protein